MKYVKYLEGDERKQATFLPEMLEDYVGEKNPARVIDAYVDSLNLKELGFIISTAETGRPSYNPRDMLKLYIYGFLNKIRSSRRLERETYRNIELMWLIKRLRPDHKTIARFRKDNAEAMKNVFKDFVRLCMDLNLYGKELMAIDGSKFKAVNGKDRNFGKKKLAERIARLESRIEEYTKQLDENDGKEDGEDAEEKGKSTKEIKSILSELSARKTTYQGYLEELRKTGETQKSLTDPDSRLMMADGRMKVCYNVQTVVDSKNKLVVDFEATSNPFDINQLTPMATAAARVLGKENIAVTADVGYDSATDIGQCLLQGITPHIAGTDYDICIPTEGEEECEITTHKDGRSIHLPDRNVAMCPMGKTLYPGGYKGRNGRALFYNMRACGQCQCKCTVESYKRFEIAMKETDFKKTYHDENIRVKQVRIKADKEIVSQRKCLSEHPFGTIKRSMDPGYLLTTGLEELRGELALTFLAYNLKRVINILGTPFLLKAIGALYSNTYILCFYAFLAGKRNTHVVFG